MDKRLESFLQNLVHQVHGDTLPAALAEKMMLDLNMQLQQKLHQVTLEALASETDRIEYQNLVLGEASADTLSTFLRDRVPNLNTILATCVSDFQQHYIKICQNRV